MPGQYGFPFQSGWPGAIQGSLWPLFLHLFLYLPLAYPISHYQVRRSPCRELRARHTENAGIHNQYFSHALLPTLRAASMCPCVAMRPRLPPAISFGSCWISSSWVKRLIPVCLSLWATAIKGTIISYAKKNIEVLCETET